MTWRDRLRWPRPRVHAVDQIVQSARDARNPSSLHEAGRRGRSALDRLSAALVARLGLAERDVDVVLTGGGVEAMQIAAEGRRLVLGARSTAIGRAVLPRGDDGERLDVLVDDRDASVAGPVSGLVDATVALGRVALPGRLDGASVVVLAGELSGGPAGIGALVRRRGTPLEPLWGGGGQEHGVRPGTQPAALAEGWAWALEAEPELDRLRAMATRIAESLDRLGLEIVNAPDAAAGIVVARGPRAPDVVSALGAAGAHPAVVDRHTLRFAVDADDRDDDIEKLTAALDAAG